MSFLAGAILLSAASTPTDPGLDVEIHSKWFFSKTGERPLTFGVFPVRIRINNLVASPRKLRVAVGVNSSWLRGNFDTSVTLPSRGRVELTLPILVPPSMYGAIPTGFHEFARITITEGGKRVFGRSFFLDSPRIASWKSATVLFIAEKMPRLPDAVSGARVPEAGPKSPPKEGFRIVPQSRESRTSLETYLLSPDSIPPHIWQPYAWTGAIVVSRSALLRLDAVQKEALWKYAAWGGTVVLLGARPQELLPPALGKKLEKKSGPLPDLAVYPLLFGRILTAEMSAGGPDTLRFLLEDYAGRSLWNQRHDFRENLASQFLSYREYGTSRTSWGDEYPLAHTNDLVELFRKPATTTYITVLAVFILLAGPLNYLVLRKLGKPILLLVTGPALSFIFVLVVLGSTILSKGTALNQTLVTFSYADQESGLATTIARFALFSTIPPSEIRIPRDRLVIPLWEPERIRIESGTELRLIGLVKPLTPAPFFAAEVTSVRGGIAVKEEEGKPVAVNGTTETVQRLLVGWDGSLFTTANLKPGEKATLSPVRLLSLGKALSAGQVVSVRRIAFALGRLAKRRSGVLNPVVWCRRPVGKRFFLALFEKPPYWRPIPGVRTLPGEHFVYGDLTHAP